MEILSGEQEGRFDESAKRSHGTRVTLPFGVVRQGNNRKTPIIDEEGIYHSQTSPVTRCQKEVDIGAPMSEKEETRSTRRIDDQMENPKEIIERRWNRNNEEEARGSSWQRGRRRTPFCQMPDGR
ncbi:17382_t:CDS:2 [Acaulospora colombiana]|uniref:17382_t:CDS:1 n=1 Tax=Acaulospora colombiana TaxID=27376 RepID=A0ACA9KCR5_9GLOM|nr:17382_t:CDS:2 [Acaulospora colombiana]